jgi:23S rRNA pseudouridine2605 synthase
MAAERLQKIIAAAGIASRRKAEELITGGRVTVNGHTITELGSKADPETDHIKVDGKLLRGPERHVYILLNKPKGYVTTVSDPEGRPTVMDLVKHVNARIYPVGRLDWSSEGLLLLTNDGELASKLTHASSHVPKTYLVKIAGQASEEDIEKLRRGIRIGAKPAQGAGRSRGNFQPSAPAHPSSRKGGAIREPSPWGPERRFDQVFTAPAQVRLIKDAANPWYEVTLIEGKNRQIRRMFEEIGHHVEKIKRVKYGPLTLNVEPGQARELTPVEVSALRRSVREDGRKPFKRKSVQAKNNAANHKRGRRRSPQGKREMRNTESRSRGRFDRRG